MFTNDLKGQGKTIFEEINSAKQVSFSLLFMILRHSRDKAKFANKTLNSTLINSSQIFRRSQKILFFK